MRSALLDGGVIAFVAERRRRAADEFGVDPSDDPVPDLEWGQKPEFRGHHC